MGGVLRGEIIYIDRFGNAITNINTLAGSVSKIRVQGRVECDLKKFYQEVAPGQPLGIIGSSGFLEIAVNNGNAAQELGLRVGDRVEVRLFFFFFFFFFFFSVIENFMGRVG